MHVGYLYPMTDVPMPPKSPLAIIAVCSNLFLFYLLMVLQNKEGFHLLFVAIRVIFLTSLIMQILMAIGFVKIPGK